MTMPKIPLAAFQYRLGAFIIDFSIIASIILLIIYPLGILSFLVFLGVDLSNLEADPRLNDPQTNQLFGIFSRAFIVISSSVIYWFYSAFLESCRWQATIGKRIMGLYITDINGGKITFRKAAIRAGTKILCGIIPYAWGAMSIPFFSWFGYFINCGMVLLTEKHQGIHDMTSQTLVVKKVDKATISLIKVQRDDAISILFLAADPTNSSRLRLGEELREIQEKLQLAQLREQFELHQRMSVRPSDISQALLDVQPQIVHFSGHGTSAGALCFENQIGEMQFIQPEALAALFEQFASRIDCVVLNACYSEIQAKAIAKHIANVVGMNKAIGDKAAIAFAVGFYQGLGAGRSIEEAYKLGCVQIGLQGIPENLTPVLINR
ncbi:MAG: RDD family protein [Anaerolineales bacterium]